jgi:hypothetical protein
MFIPTLWGIDAFLYVSGVVFLVTVAADAWFHGPLGRGPIALCSVTATSQEAPARRPPELSPTSTVASCEGVSG